MKGRFTIILMVMFLLNITVNAQWQNTGPEGGMVYKVISNNGIQVCLTGGGVYRSVNNGDSWVPSNTNLPDEITGIIVHNNKFYVSTKVGIYSSVDALSWALTPNGTFAAKVVFSNGTSLFVEYNGKMYYSINDGAGSLAVVRTALLMRLWR